jgi:hypothetical protein
LHICENPKMRQTISRKLEFVPRNRFSSLQAGRFGDFLAFVSVGSCCRYGCQALAPRLWRFECACERRGWKDCKYRDDRESESAEISGKRC